MSGTFIEKPSILKEMYGLDKIPTLRTEKTISGKLNFVMFSGRYIRGLNPTRDEVDLLVIGDVVLPELQALVKEAEKHLGRELNYAVFSLEEFVFRKTRRDPFVMDILFGSRVMVIGDEVEFVHRETPGIGN
jgi:hypothetical protein